MRHLALGSTLLLCAVPLTSQGLVGEWRFEAAHVRDGKLRDLKGSNHGRIAGRHRFAKSPPGMVFHDREDRVTLSRNLRRAKLPTRALTVEAWTCVDEPAKWGGIVSALQDNGGFEKGWVLGFNGKRFCIALASKGADDGDGKMTYLKAPADFVSGHWHHLVGTYDGKTLALHVDGKRVAETAAQSGDILYPARATFEAGAYVDDDEHYPLRGMIGRVRMWRRALDADDIAKAYANDKRTYQVTNRTGPAKEVGRWRFAHQDLRGVEVEGQGETHEVGALPALVFDGSTTSAVVRKPPRPKRALTVEACVWIGDDRRRAALAGVDSGDARRLGWRIDLLDGRLRFGLETDDGAAGMTFASAVQKVKPFRWYYVACTYDGGIQRLFVDGQAVGFARGEFGEVTYPEDPTLRFGADRTRHGMRHALGMLHEVAVHDGVLEDAAIRTRHTELSAKYPKPLELTLGPVLQFTSQDTAEVRWRTDQRGPGFVELLDPAKGMRRVPVEDTDSMRVATIHGLESERTYHYRIGAFGNGKAELASAAYPIETEFNYSLPKVRPANGGARGVRIDKGWLDSIGIDRGYCLMLGAEDVAENVTDLIDASKFQIVVVDRDESHVRELREKLAAAGVYGPRATALHCPGKTLPFGDYTFNLVLTAAPGVPHYSSVEVERVLRPDGGIAEVAARGPNSLRNWASRAWESTDPDILEFDNRRFQRPKLPDSGEWTHQYGSLANTAASNDNRISGGLDLQWFGRPGPRPMVDRGARTPAPLYAQGRLIVQGDCRLFGLDAYNGTVLWSLEIPALKRTNVPRDSTNMTIRGRSLYVAIEDHCWVIDAQTGTLQKTIPVPKDLAPDEDPAWGYLALTDDLLLGTATRERAFYKGVDGEWYDKAGPDTYDVIAKSIFALDRETHAPRWEYANGWIVHPTITVYNDAIYFVEDRAPDKRSVQSGRLHSQNGEDQYLVALDLKSGQKLFEKQHDFRNCDRVFYLSAADGLLILTGSSSKYHVRGIDASSGDIRWTTEFEWQRDHHGGAMQHPVLVGGKIYLENRILDHATGKIERDDLPKRRGCGTMSGSLSSVFYRHYTHTMWDLEADKRTEMPELRPGCWLGLIPAGGLLLAPESSSGCSCTNQLQTSVAFRPVPAN